MNEVSKGIGEIAAGANEVARNVAEAAAGVTDLTTRITEASVMLEEASRYIRRTDGASQECRTGIQAMSVTVDAISDGIRRLKENGWNGRGGKAQEAGN